MCRLNQLALILVWLILEVNASQALHIHPPCKISYHCSNERELVWASDGRRCHVFHNECYMKNEECKRSNRGDSPLIIEDRETCNEHCTVECEDGLFEPICAEIFGQTMSFSNECVMRNSVCEKERPVSFFMEGVCVVPGNSAIATVGYILKDEEEE